MSRAGKNQRQVRSDAGGSGVGGKRKRAPIGNLTYRSDFGYYHCEGDKPHAVTYLNASLTGPSNTAQATRVCGPLAEGEVVTKYYYFGDQRVAMLQDGILYFVHSDHLGSTNVLSNNSGNVAGEAVRYYPYGTTRVGDVGTLPTDYLFTGQRQEAPLGGLYHMGARFYDPATGRWLSADSIIPDETDPQALNRYAYT